MATLSQNVNGLESHRRPYHRCDPAMSPIYSKRNRNFLCAQPKCVHVSMHAIQWVMHCVWLPLELWLCLKYPTTIIPIYSNFHTRRIQSLSAFIFSINFTTAMHTLTFGDPFIDLAFVNHIYKCRAIFLTQMLIVDNFLQAWHATLFIHIVIVNAWCQPTVCILNGFADFLNDVRDDITSITFISIRIYFTRYCRKMLFLFQFFLCPSKRWARVQINWSINVKRFYLSHFLFYFFFGFFSSITNIFSIKKKKHNAFFYLAQQLQHFK